MTPFAGARPFLRVAPLATALALAACRREPAAVTVFAAASLTESFRELGDSFAARRPGPAIVFNFAGTPQLAAQLEHGAQADVFASADTRWMERLAARGLLAAPPAAPAVFARNRLVVVAPKDGTVRRLEDLAQPGVRLVVAAPAVPAGRLAREALARLGTAPGFGAGWTSAALRGIVSEEDNVKAVVAKVQLGEADAGFVYRSDVTPAVAERVRMIDIPDRYNPRTSYPIAVLRGAHAGPRRVTADAFVAYVLSGEGQRILGRHGFLPANAGAADAARR